MLKKIDVQLKDVPELVSNCLVLHNICIILGDNYWKTEWLQEASDEVHNGLSLMTPPGLARQEKLAVANHALHSLAGIEESFQETLEYIKQETAREFQISMTIGGKTAKELCARRHGIAKSLWMAKTRACVAKTFPMDVD